MHIKSILRQEPTNGRTKPTGNRKKLNEQFTGGQRLIFWYDADASFEAEVDRLQLGDVQILHLTENNAFRTKLLLEHEDTEGQYLIYAPFEKPAVAKNHLEDTLLYSKEFYADRLSLIAAEIGLPSRLRGSLEALKTFFAAGGGKLKAQERQAGVRRTNAFLERARELDLSGANGESLSLIAMCVISKARNTAMDDLFYSVLSYGDIYAQEVVAEFARNGLDREFWKICESRFGYQDSRPTLLKFTLSLFAVYTCREDFALLPKAWETYAPDTMRRKTSNISVLLENMMNNVLYQECFDEISLMASGELQAERALNRFPREELLHMNSFAVIDDLLISWMIDRELAEDKNAAVSGMSIPDICQERLRRHFGSGKKAEYAALLAGYSLLQATDFMPKETLQELIASYCERDYRIDTEYRKFITALDAMEDTAAFEQLADLVQNIYSTDYLEKIVYKWNAAYEKNGLHHSAITHTAGEQRKFYRDKVAPLREKVAVIISDGLRYEAAKELEDRLREDENTNVSMSAMLASLPTITSVGMGCLLPHEKMELSEEKAPKVMLDGSPSVSTAQREAILKRANENACAVDFDTVKDMKSKDLKELSVRREVIYIYHNRIDATGEASRTENSVFDAVEKTVEGIWCIVQMDYEYIEEDRKNGTPVQIRKLTPIQMPHIDMEELRQGRKAFCKGQWLDVLLRSVGMEPEALSYREKWLILTRMIPLVENNFNLCELGPRSTGKSHLYKEISPNSILVSGGQTTVANLFYNMGRKTVGLVGLWDCVAFDEVAGIHFKDKDGIQIMKDYMASGSFARGKEEKAASASMVFVGNINQSVDVLLKTSSLFDPFPPEMGTDTAFLDRVHCYLPGWEIPKFRPEHFTDDYGFISDYLAEVMRELRKEQFGDGLDRHFRLGRNLNQRDTIAVRKMVGGYLKLLYPDGAYTKEELEEALRMALEMRRRVKEQLKKLGGMEFYDVNFSYIDNETFEEKFVSVPEQGGGRLIPEGLCSPGQIYTVSRGKSGMIGVFRLESQMLPGGGRFERTGLGSDREAKEAANTAFNFLKANSHRISGTISTTTKDYIVHYQDLQGIGMTDRLALPTLIALCSISLGRPVLGSMAVLGEISISGILQKVDDGLASVLQACLDNGARKVLLPISSAGDLSSVPAELIGSFNLIFYNSAEDAVFKALGVE